MHIYLVAGGIKASDEKNVLSKYAKNRLTSYHYYSPNAFNLLCRLSKRNPEFNIFLDSGAFSAHTQNAEIDIYDYIKFIKKFEKFLHIYAVLDVIGDENATLKNQQIMEGKGLKPIPTFHKGEAFSSLKYYIENYDYIALGGMVGVSNPIAREHLDKCFDLICDNKGNAKVKVHGFGITSFDLLTRYPWHSSDSTAWIMTGGMGSIVLANNGDYSKPPLKIVVSEKSPKSTDFGKHYDSFNPYRQKVICDYLDSIGYTIEQAREVRNDRCLINSHYYVGFENYLTNNPPKHKSHISLF